MSVLNTPCEQLLKKKKKLNISQGLKNTTFVA